VATQRTHRIVIAVVGGLFVALFALVYLLPRPAYHSVTPDAAFLSQAHLDPSGFATGHSDASLLAAAHAICSAEAAGQAEPALPPDFSGYQILLPANGGGLLETFGAPADSGAEMAIALVTDAEFTICPRPGLTP